MICLNRYVTVAAHNWIQCRTHKQKQFRVSKKIIPHDSRILFVRPYRTVRSGTTVGKKNHSISYLFSFFSDLFFLSKFSIHINSMDINAKLIITKKKLEPQHICRYIRNTTQQKWKSRKIHSAIYYNTRAMKIDWKAQPHTRFDVSEYIGK